jgi:hypothetical protein
MLCHCIRVKNLWPLLKILNSYRCRASHRVRQRYSWDKSIRLLMNLRVYWSRLSLDRSWLSDSSYRCHSSSITVTEVCFNAWIIHTSGPWSWSYLVSLVIISRLIMSSPHHILIKPLVIRHIHLLLMSMHSKIRILLLGITSLLPISRVSLTLAHTFLLGTLLVYLCENRHVNLNLLNLIWNRRS